MTRIESKTVTVDKSANELYNMMLDFRNFHKVMPESVTKFESDENSFLFAMKGMPEVTMVLEEKREPEYILFKSAGKIEFSLACYLTPKTENTCEAHFEFIGHFNAMLRMMVEKPLKNFIETLADKMSRL